METTNQMYTAEPDVLLDDTVCIPRNRYDELIRAEMEREILFHAYQLMDGFSMDSVMDAIFNPDFKRRDKKNADHKAGADDAE